ncbi:putative reverse transcriptase domain-containing protein [Tanacetum coccineum]|uniref:Reverse transcriptase domain-containing protein n=1 Tax=Tanacetum coccineum TaxID=301880 RepID=A0ABQ4X3E5_9ASTR
MDRLSKRKFGIVCHGKVVRIPLGSAGGSQVMVIVLMESRKTLMKQSVDEPKLSDISVVEDSLMGFPKIVDDSTTTIKEEKVVHLKLEWEFTRMVELYDLGSSVRDQNMNGALSTVKKRFPDFEESNVKDKILTSKVGNAPAECCVTLDQNTMEKIADDGLYFMGFRWMILRGFWKTLSECVGVAIYLSMLSTPQVDLQKVKSPVLWAEIGKSSLIGPELVQETTDKVVLIKEKLKSARDRQKRCVICFRKKGKLAPRYVGHFEILERIGPVAYRLRLREELSGVHDTFSWELAMLSECEVLQVIISRMVIGKVGFGRSEVFKTSGKLSIHTFSLSKGSLGVVVKVGFVKCPMLSVYLSDSVSRNYPSSKSFKAHHVAARNPELHRYRQTMFSPTRKKSRWGTVFPTGLKRYKEPLVEPKEIGYSLIPLSHGSLDVIMGMDWLSKRKFVIVCHEKVVRIPIKEGGILRVHGERTLGAAKALMNAKIDEPKLSDISVVRDFIDVFPEDLSMTTAATMGDALSRKERVKSRRVRGMILAAQSEAFKQENVLTERLHGLDPQMERKGDESLYFMDRIWVLLVGSVMDEAHASSYTRRFQDVKLARIYIDEIIARNEILHPQADGQSESMIQTLEDIMRACDIDFGGSYHLSIQCAPFEALYGRKCRSPVLWEEIGGSSLIGPELVQEMINKVVLVKEKPKVARDRQKSYADKRRKPLEFEVGDQVLLKVSPWKSVVRFGKKGKLAPRYVGPFEIFERIVPIAYRLRLPEELIGVHVTFHVSNLKKCLGNANLHVPLNEIKIDKTLRFVNSKHGPKFTWERKDYMKSKYPQLFVNRADESAG